MLHFIRRILTFNEIGLTLQQKKGSLLPSSIVTLVLAGWATLVGISSPKGDFDASTLIYLVIMPALNEELVYRGCLLEILNIFRPGKFNFLGAWSGWGAIITSILFSLLHGFWLDNNLFIHFEVIALSNSFMSGFFFA